MYPGGQDTFSAYSILKCGIMYRCSKKLHWGMEMRVLTGCFAVYFCLSMLTGCGTLVRGSTETYQIFSEPIGAIAVFSSGEICTTPCAVEKKRNEPFFVRVLKDGYQPYDIRVEEKKYEGRKATMLANLLMFGSVIWASIDSLSGANKELTPNPSQAILIPTDIQTAGYELLSEQLPEPPELMQSTKNTYRW